MAATGAMADFELPQASITRIVKTALPDNMQVSREAKMAFSKSAGVFILYLTSAANDICKRSKRQTINVHDILSALEEVDFGEFNPAVEEYLAAYRLSVAKRGQGGSSRKGDALYAGAAPGASAHGAAATARMGAAGMLTGSVGMDDEEADDGLGEDKDDAIAEDGAMEPQL